MNTKTPIPVVLSAAMYFSYYMALGAFFPFIGLYYERIGLSGIQIGSLTAVSVLVSSTTVLFWSSIADGLRWHRRILRFALLLTAATVLLLSTATTYRTLLPFIMTYAFFISPIVPLLDSFTLEVAEGHNRSYGEMRLWGSIGWSISTIVVGLIIQRFDIVWLFYCYTALLLVTFTISLFQSRRKQVKQLSLRRGLNQLLMNRSILLFLFSIFLVSLSLNAVNAFFSIYLDAIGASEGAIGLGWAIASASEIPVLLFSGRLAKRMGATGLLKISFAAFILRWLLYSFISTPTLAILVQALHGFSFGTFLVGSVTYVNERAPEGLSTTAQSVLNLVTFGIGSITGSLVGGYLFETIGIPSYFRILSLIVVVAFGLFLLSQRIGDRQPAVA